MPATMERPTGTTERRRRAIGAAVGAVALAAGLVPLAGLLDDGGRVDLRIENPTEQPVGVTITGPSGGVLHVAHLGPASTRLVVDLLHDGGDLDVTWTVDGRPVATSTVPAGDDAVVPPDLRP